MTPDRNADRRAAIIDAAYRCMARHGYERTTTTLICRTASVSSGTFFHYFPTKAAVLVAVLEQGLEHTREAYARIRATAAQDAVAALHQWCDHVLAEAADEHLAGFIAVLGAVPDDPQISAVLRAESALTRTALTELAAAGQAQGTIRTDRAADRIAVWLGILAHGVLEHAAENGPVSADDLRPEMIDACARLVDPRPTIR